MATYQLLPTLSSSSSTSTLHQYQSSPILQRKALSFTILILMVATATLITIIRFTVNPALNGQTFVQPTNAFAAIHRAQMLAIQQQLQQQKQQQQFNNNQIVSEYSSSSSSSSTDQHEKQIRQNINHHKYNTILSRDNDSNDINYKSKLIQIGNTNTNNTYDNNNEMTKIKLQSSLLNTNNFNSLQSSSSSLIIPDLKLNSNSNNPIQTVSPSSKSVTSLMADQRYEKDYRDDPVTMSTISTLNNINSNKKTSKHVNKIKVIYDRNDLAETEHMNIDHDDGCGEDFGAYADLVVIVNSAVYNFDARSAIRETWGKFAIERGAYFYFLLGATENQRIQNLVENENEKFNDILQGKFIDNYYNLTLKTITMMRWISTKCSKIRYVLKVDDDMMMNMQHACDFTEINPNFHKVIIGKLAKKWKPHRYKSSKWYVPYEAYNQTYFPNFVTGPAYFFTGDAAKLLYETSVNRTIPFYLEDVYMTGIVAETAGIKRYNHAMMRNVHLKLDNCIFPKIMTSHKHKPNEIRELWKSLYSGQKCVKNSTIIRTTPKTINNNNKQQQQPQQLPSKDNTQSKT